MPSWRWVGSQRTKGVPLKAGRIPSRVHPVLYLGTGEILAYFRSVEALEHFEKWMDEFLFYMDAESWGKER